MTTEARIHANRLNAQRSTGPKTQKGKAVVSQNALKHGLSARHDVVITENQEDFDRHREPLLEELSPQGPITPSPKTSVQSASYKYIRIRLYTSAPLPLFGDRCQYLSPKTQFT